MDAPSFSSPSAVGTAPGDEFLPAETDAAVPAFPGLNLDPGSIDEGSFQTGNRC